MPYLFSFFLLVVIMVVNGWWMQRYAVLNAELLREKLAREAEQHHHRQESDQLEAEQRALFNSISEGVLVLDQKGKVELVNHSLREFFNLKEDVAGRSLMETFNLPGLVEVNRRLAQERVVQGCELELPGAIGRWMEVNAAILERTGRQVGSILVFHDLTRLKQLESTRQEFVANVSHELRTPLSLIKGFVETLLDGAKNDPELTTRFLRTIQKHTDRLTFLIEDLLTISRLESGQIVMNLHQVELREEANHVLDDLHSRAAEKHITLENGLPAELQARADADRLQQVLFNLVENAIKYGRTDGAVSLGGRLKPDGKVELWVKDDGAGIPPEARERIFERFYRVDRARSRETGGTGLGLSIVKHIVQAHGGEVWVKSEAGQGATFYFTLPQG